MFGVVKKVLAKLVHRALSHFYVDLRLSNA